MKTLEALQRDMATTADLQEIVRTMKVLAAVSIRQYERAQESLQHYHRSIELGLQAVLKQSPANTALLNLSQPMTGAVIFGSDHGLCGRYNDNIVEFAMQELNSINRKHDSQRRVVVGARIESSLHAMNQSVEACFRVPGAVGNITAAVQKILLKIDDWQQEGVGQVILFHHVRRQRGNYQPEARKLLPIDLHSLGQNRNKPWPSRSLPQFSLNANELLSSLIRQHLFIKIFSAFTESLAGEHASRLMSMQLAEKNIKQRLESLTGVYRQQRQDQITGELLDVISGYETLNDPY